jgi:hypothetical protein
MGFRSELLGGHPRACLKFEAPRVSTSCPETKHLSNSAALRAPYRKAKLTFYPHQSTSSRASATFPFDTNRENASQNFALENANRSSTAFANHTRRIVVKVFEIYMILMNPLSYYIIRRYIWPSVLRTALVMAVGVVRSGALSLATRPLDNTRTNRYARTRSF